MENLTVVRNANTYLGPCAPSGSFSMMSMSLSVQSPAERMWTLKKSSSGAEVMVNGCHSSCEMAGQLRKTYWPTSILKPFFTSCSSSTLDGRITICKKKKKFSVRAGPGNMGVKQLLRASTPAGAPQDQHHAKLV